MDSSDGRFIEDNNEVWEEKHPITGVSNIVHQISVPNACGSNVITQDL